MFMKFLDNYGIVRRDRAVLYILFTTLDQPMPERLSIWFKPNHQKKFATINHLMFHPLKGMFWFQKSIFKVVLFWI